MGVVNVDGCGVMYVGVISDQMRYAWIALRVDVDVGSTATTVATNVPNTLSR